MSINSLEDVVVEYINQLRDNLREAQKHLRELNDTGYTMIKGVEEGYKNLIADLQAEIEKLRRDPELHPSHAEAQTQINELRAQIEELKHAAEAKTEFYKGVEMGAQTLRYTLREARDEIDKLRDICRKQEEDRKELDERLTTTAARVVHKYTSMVSFISEASVWHLQTFGEAAFKDKRERAARLIEEALETGQALGLDAYVMHKLVDYVMAKPPGLVNQEMGGVIVCWALLCGSLSGVNPDKIMQDALDDCWKRQAMIKAKHQGKIAEGVSGSALWLHEGNATKVEPLVGVGPAEWDTKVESRTETRSMHIDGSKIIAEGRKAHEDFINETRQPGRGEEIDRGTM